MSLPSAGPGGQSLGGVRRARVEGDVVSVVVTRADHRRGRLWQDLQGARVPPPLKMLGTGSRYYADRTKALFLACSALASWPLGFEVADSPLRLKMLRHYRSGEVLLLI